jgi:hypothetical protein
MMFISIDSSTDAPRSVAAAGTTRPDCCRRVRGREMSGGKGAKGGNLDSLGNTGPAGDVVQRRKPAETGGNSFWGPHGGAKVFSGAGIGRAGIGGAGIGPPRRSVGDWRIACGNCGNPHGRKLSPAAPTAVGKNSRSPQSRPAQYRVVLLPGRRVSAVSGRRPRCLTGVGVAPILPHRKNGLKSRKDKAF